MRGGGAEVVGGGDEVDMMEGRNFVTADDARRVGGGWCRWRRCGVIDNGFEIPGQRDQQLQNSWKSSEEVICGSMKPLAQLYMIRLHTRRGITQVSPKSGSQRQTPRISEPGERRRCSAFCVIRSKARGSPVLAPAKLCRPEL